jgi:hypothetical protein
VCGKEKEFLEERANFFASKLQCLEEKALQAILRAEETKRTYCYVRKILGKQPSALTQVYVQDESNASHGLIMLTSQEYIISHIMARNGSTPFNLYILLSCR